MAQFLLCCEADAKGRTGFENTPYPSGQWLQEVVGAVSEIDNQSLIEKGLSGKQFGKALEQMRLDVIAQKRALYNTQQATHD